MAKYSCTQKECIKLHKENDEDIRLHLTIRDTPYTTYHMNPDGSLEYYDGDSEGQEHIIKCPVCNTEYSFKYDLGHLFEQHILPLKTGDIKVVRK